jgi:hypothetical protein
VIARLVLLAAVGCASEHRSADEPLPGHISAACELTRYRCSRCHTTERIDRMSLDAVGWQRQVRRMRLLPDSAIHLDEEPSLVRCLVFITDRNRRLSLESP